jgi:hypothetical protein
MPTPLASATSPKMNSSCVSLRFCYEHDVVIELSSFLPARAIRTKLARSRTVLHSSSESIVKAGKRPF